MVRKAVVVGINYVSNGRMLRGACADAYSWEQLLAGDLGFAPSRIRTLTDEDREGFARQGPAENLPTHEAIVAALEWLVEGAAPGDVIVFVFAGFATQVLDPMKHDKEPVDTGLAPCDFREFDYLVRPRLG
mmetsp:Transcript_98426/g.226178  ORF Transcript_98426/g.226178 Transcript_98426/m.226178 type:complete len:131 (+) Transcript_98426:23-415(+)